MSVGRRRPIVVRRGGEQDVRFLRDMLHHAYYWKERAPDTGPGPGGALRQGLGTAGRHGRDRDRGRLPRRGRLVPPLRQGAARLRVRRRADTRAGDRGRPERARPRRRLEAASTRCSRGRGRRGTPRDLAQRRPCERGRDRALRAPRLRAGGRETTTPSPCSLTSRRNRQKGPNPHERRRRRPRRRPGRVHGRDPRRPARRQGRVHRTGAQAGRNLPPRGLHPHEGVGAERARLPRRARDVRQARRPGGRADARLRHRRLVEGRRRRADDRRRRVALQGERRRVGQGQRQFTSPTTIAVEGAEEVTFKSAIVATGSYPIRPPIPGIDSPRCVDSTGLLAQTEVPGRLVVLGGGIIGCEFASIFNRFGTEVTIIEMLPTLIPLEDEDAAKELAKAFKKRGIALHLSKQCTQVDDHGEPPDRALRRRGDRRLRPDARLGRPSGARRRDRARGGRGHLRPKGDRDGRPQAHERPAHLRGRRRRGVLAARAHGLPRRRGRRGERDGSRGDGRRARPSRGRSTRIPRSRASASPRRRRASSTATTSSSAAARGPRSRGP